jgi:hypothetical protein
MENLVCIKVTLDDEFDSNAIAYCLLDSNLLKDPLSIEGAIQNPNLLVDALYKSYKSIIFLNTSMAKSCYGSYELMNWAAEKGYGKLLFDLVLNDIGNKPIVLDRKSVSPEAKLAWASLFKETNKYDFLPLDNFSKKLTPGIDDDCLTHSELGGYKLLGNYAIDALLDSEKMNLDQTIDYAVIAKNYINVSIPVFEDPKYLGQLLGHKAHYIEDEFINATMNFFKIKYLDMLIKRAQSKASVYDVTFAPSGEVKRKKINESILRKYIHNAIKKYFYKF